MKKFIISVVVFLVLGGVFLFRYKLIAALKRTLTDNIVIQDVLVKRKDLILIVKSEDSTLLKAPLKIGSYKLPRYYGKNLFFIESSDTLRYLDASYHKWSVWQKSNVNLEISQSGNSLLVYWKRTYPDSITSGKQVILFGNKLLPPARGNASEMQINN